MGDAILKAENLSAGYDGKAVLENLNFEVTRGEIFVILGGSGCGKSTLLKHLIGLLPPIQGRVMIENRDLGASEGAERDAILRRIGVAYQSGALFGSFTLAENVRLPLEELTDLPPGALDLISWLKLSMVGLGDFREFLPDAISGGMKKRAALARAMALDPAIVFLDEPSAGLDPITSAALDELILRIRDDLGLTFVIVTHELASIYTLADRVIMLDKSARGIIAEGVPTELRDHSPIPGVRKFFRRETDDSAR